MRVDLKTAMGWALMWAGLIFLVASSDAIAGGKDKKPPPPTTVKNYYNDNDTTNTETIDQDQSQGQEQMQGQDQSQSMGDQANQQSITYTSPKDIRIENTVGPDTPNIYPQNPCALVWSAGGSVAGFAASGGKAYIDKGCEVRAWAALMFQLGARDAAVYRLCMMEEAEGVPECQGVQDYNKEMQLMKLGHDQLVKDNTELRDSYNRLLELQGEESAACQESVRRVGNELESCLKK